ncbi:hypothetical protein [Planctomicrobium sp. SH664]|uniref:hypothetical protein n=1 Tax=Planctomicrobium sp. SH664 TaxID=3448125 RepID=UPI003F5B03A6
MTASTLSRISLVRETFALLLGGETTVKESKSALTPTEVGGLAEYSDQAGAVRHYILCDFAFANTAGAALSMIGPAVIQKAIQRRVVEENVVDNFREVLNIASNLFQTPYLDAPRLSGVHLTTGPAVQLPPLVVLESFEVQVPRYPLGRITLAAAGA